MSKQTLKQPSLKQPALKQLAGNKPISTIPITQIETEYDISQYQANDLIIDATQSNPAVRLAKGFYQKIRRVITAPLIALFVCAPWLTFDQMPLVQMDLTTRQLHLFGFNLWPDDLLVLTWLALASAFALFAVANFAGRLWCGFTCPQTVWSMMFIWVEEKIEGSRHQRLRNTKHPQTIKGVIQRIMKHIIWILLALVTGFTFVAYFETGPLLFESLINFTMQLDIIFWLIFFTLLTYINAGYLREQVCLHMCPYSRFQSVMLDSKSLKVSYDLNRGEPRKNSQIVGNTSTNKPSGDCVDCQLCVQVCPVGIDIRQGLQYACIDCGACIDACDEIMKKVNQPTGLIRFTNGSTTHWTDLLKNRNRLMAYGALTLLCCLGFVYQLGTLESFDTSINRDRGQLFFYDTNGDITNPYTIKIHNKTSSKADYKIEVTGKFSESLSPSLNAHVTISAAEMRSQNLMVTCRQPCGLPYRNQVNLKVSNGDQSKMLDFVFFNPK